MRAANSNLMDMKLYRGDSIPRPVLSADRKVRGKTFAKHFCGTGLMAKFGDGGLHSLVRGKSMRQIAEEHIGYVAGQPSEKLALHSPMLSFSSSQERAFEFLERSEKKRLRLEECPFEDATHFLWELEVGLPAPVQPGLYHIEYKADPAHCTEIVERQLHLGIETYDLNGNPHPFSAALGSVVAMNYAAADTSRHQAELIDAVAFLQEDRPGADTGVLANARERARRDFEWLLYPTDPLDGSGGPPSAAFMMNKHLSVSACYHLQA